jgi:hypothetical protein
MTLAHLRVLYFAPASQIMLAMMIVASTPRLSLTLTAL